MKKDIHVLNLGGKTITDLSLASDGEGGWIQHPQCMRLAGGTKGAFLSSPFNQGAHILLTCDSKGDFILIFGDSRKWDRENLSLCNGVAWHIGRHLEIEEGFYKDVDNDRSFRILTDDVESILFDHQGISLTADAEPGYANVTFAEPFTISEAICRVAVRRYEVVDFGSNTRFAIFSFGAQLNDDNTIQNEQCFVVTLSDLLEAGAVLRAEQRAG